jgi:hypothetical protein
MNAKTEDPTGVEEALDYLDKAAEQMVLCVEYVRTHELSEDEKARLIPELRTLRREVLELRGFFDEVTV